MKEKKIYSDLRSYPCSLVHFDQSPYIELMIYGEYSIDLFDENNIKINKENVVAVFIINYN